MIKTNVNFSLWLDFVERDFLENEFVQLVNSGVVNGATSNPSIFASAITTSPAYKEQLKTLSGLSPKEKYEALAIVDIKRAAQILRPLYDEGNDGYISIEVDPSLSQDYRGTLEEGKRLFKAIGEPNVMIKIPATEQGYKAMTGLMTNGIPVNATLVFSPQQAKECLHAMKKGIDRFERFGGRLVEGVISVFVSRFDRMLDDKLETAGIERGMIGVMNAARIYNMTELNRTPAVRTLFASTGVKGSEFAPYYYIHKLLANHTVNTAPYETIQSLSAYKDEVKEGLPYSEDAIDAFFDRVKQAGIDMSVVTDTLMQDGLVAFENAFQEMLNSLQ